MPHSPAPHRSALQDSAPHRPEPWRLSLVVPVFNEEHALVPFLSATLPTLEACAPELEILFVDDGSQDGTLPQLRKLAASDSRIRYLAFSRNFGKEAALSAGIEHARGDAVVLIDADLQDPPELIATFIRHWRDEGYDMVYGVRQTRRADSTAKRQTAGWFYHIFNRVSETPIPTNAGDFRLLDRRVVEALRRLPERNRFMKGLYAWTGFRQLGVPYHRPARQVGSSKFHYWKLWNFALDGIFSFSTLPLRVWSYLGGVVALLAFCYIVVIITKVLLLGRDVPGYASLMTTVLFFGGMQLLSIGVLGEYLGRLVTESKRRPLYLIAETSEPPEQKGAE